MNVNTGIRFLLVLLLLNPNLIPAQEKGQSSLFFIPLKLAAIDTYIPDSQTDINNILYSLLVQVPGLSVTLLSGEIDTDSFKDEKNVIKYQQACSCLVYGKILEKQNGIYCAVVLKSINFSEIKEEKIEFPFSGEETPDQLMSYFQPILGILTDAVGWGVLNLTVEGEGTYNIYINGKYIGSDMKQCLVLSGNRDLCVKQIVKGIGIPIIEMEIPEVSHGEIIRISFTLQDIDSEKERFYSNELLEPLPWEAVDSVYKTREFLWEETR